MSTPELDARMAYQPLGGVLRRDESVQVNFRKSLVRLGDYSLAGMGKIHEGKEVEDGGRMGVLAAAGIFSFLVVTAMVGMTVMMVGRSMIGRMGALGFYRACGDGSMIMETVAMAAVENGVRGKSEAY